MIAVVQRVSGSRVTIGGSVAAEIGVGLTVLLGVADGDRTVDSEHLAAKVVNLRIFEDDQGKFNRSLIDVGGQMLVVSQFTLLADCRKGRRPSFINAAQPVLAEPLYRHFVETVRRQGVDALTGCFGATMQVSIINEGPVTLLLHSR